MNPDINITPNSHKYRNEMGNKKDSNTKNEKEKIITKIANGKVVNAKPGLLRKLQTAIVSTDNKDVGSYIVEDIIAPSIKKAISDIVTNGTDMFSDTIRSGADAFLWGDPDASRKRRTRSSHISYDNYSSRDRGHSFERRESSSVYDYGDIILDSRGEAEEVLYKMDELIETYGIVSVLDLFDMVGASTRPTDEKYGWTNLRGASAERAKHGSGYILRLPKARPLD